MESNQNQESKTKKVIVADFTAFSRRCKKFYEDKNESHIHCDLIDTCPTFILHSITEYTVSEINVTEFTKPFVPAQVEVKSKEDGEEVDESKPTEGKDYLSDQQTNFVE